MVMARRRPTPIAPVAPCPTGETVESRRNPEPEPVNRPEMHRPSRMPAEDVQPAGTPSGHYLRSDFDNRLREALRKLGSSGEERLLTVSLPLPAMVSCKLPSPFPGSMYWANAGRELYRFGIGRAVTLEASGNKRFQSLDRTFSELCRRWVHADPGLCGAQALAFLGLSFEPEETGPGFATATVQVPELLLERVKGKWRVSLSSLLRPAMEPEALHATWLKRADNFFARLEAERDNDFVPQMLPRIETMPSDGEWLARVERALGAIREGRLKKVVLSRRLRVRGRRRLQARRLIDWLEEQYPDCAQFAYAGEDYTLVGASPERLVRLVGSRVTSDALASTTARGSDRPGDEYLAASLLASSKARKEHQLVVNDIVAALKPVCKALEVPHVPGLLKLPNLQHLWSPIRGEVRSGVSILQIIGRLHPTPAVGGVPRERALSWLAEEGECRGWYTGALGWLSADGAGEVSVVLRCAVLRGRTAELYAGAGIVAGSDPRMELAETELKFRTMLDALARA